MGKSQKPQYIYKITVNIKRHYMKSHSEEIWGSLKSAVRNKSQENWLKDNKKLSGA